MHFYGLQAAHKGLNSLFLIFAQGLQKLLAKINYLHHFVSHSESWTFLLEINILIFRPDFFI